MKKTFAVFSTVCACAAGAFAGHGADEQWQTPWFNAIGCNATAATQAGLLPTNGTWTIDSADAVSWDSTAKALVLDQLSGEEISFAIGNQQPYCNVDTNTIVEVKVKAMFYPLPIAELAKVSDLEDSTNKVAFTVVQNGDTTSYYAWVKGQSAWTQLAGLPAPTSDEEIEVLIRINYRSSGTTADEYPRKVSFFVGGTQSTTHIAVPDGLTNPTGFGIAGCSTLSSVDGEVQYNVAKIGDVGYATVTEAAKYAPTGVDTTISVVRETSENVDLSTSGESIKIADNGNMSGTVTVASDAQVDIVPTAEDITSQPAAGASGSYSFDLKVTGSDNIVVELPASIAQYKEVKPGSVVKGDNCVTAVLQTHSSIITDAVDAADFQLKVTDKLREFMLTADATISNAYVAAQASAGDISAKLAEVPANQNGLARWQDYVLGIKPADSVAPVNRPSGDTENLYITLAIPAIDTGKYSGDYTVKYCVDSEYSKDPSEIRVPLATGEYYIEIRFTTPEE